MVYVSMSSESTSSGSNVKRYKITISIQEFVTNTEKSCNFKKKSISKISNSSQPLIEELITGKQVVSKQATSKRS